VTRVTLGFLLLCAEVEEGSASTELLDEFECFRQSVYVRRIVLEHSLLVKCTSENVPDSLSYVPVHNCGVFNKIKRLLRILVLTESNFKELMKRVDRSNFSKDSIDIAFLNNWLP
jgi:hypothetical protein